MSKNIEQFTGEEILGAVIENSNRIADRQVYKSLGEYAKLASKLKKEVLYSKETGILTITNANLTIN